jgi:hypothetical protein
MKASRGFFSEERGSMVIEAAVAFMATLFVVLALVNMCFELYFESAISAAAICAVSAPESSNSPPPNAPQYSRVQAAAAQTLSVEFRIENNTSDINTRSVVTASIPVKTPLGAFWRRFFGQEAGVEENADKIIKIKESAFSYNFYGTMANSEVAPPR